MGIYYTGMIQELGHLDSLIPYQAPESIFPQSDKPWSLLA